MLLCASVDYTAAPLNIRESFAFEDERAALTSIKATDGIDGCVILSTCNRSELYISTEAEIDAADLLVKYTAATDEYKALIAVYRDSDCIYHLCETACGIHSAIKREGQIITQVGEAAAQSRDIGCTDAIIDVLFRVALSTGKRAASIVGTGRGASCVSTAIERLTSVCGSLSGKRCLVIGSGKVGRLAAQELCALGADVTITLRTYKHGESIVPSGCKCIPYSDRAQALAKADILISATKSPHYTVTSAMELPKVAIDLAVPRDIEPSAIKEDTVYYGIDDFSTEGEDFSAVYEVVEQGVNEYNNWYNYRSSVESIAQIKNIIARRIAKATDYNEDEIRVITERTADMIFGSIKEVINPDVIESCLSRIRDRARL